MNTAHYKQKLEEELSLVEKELRSVGRVNPSNKEWEARPRNTDVDRADNDEIATEIEEYGENAAILKELDTRYNEIKSALQKIASGSYGICEIGGEKIEEKRLNANPAARTCIKHRDQA